MIISRRPNRIRARVNLEPGDVQMLLGFIGLVIDDFYQVAGININRSEAGGAQGALIEMSLAPVPPPRRALVPRVRRWWAPWTWRRGYRVREFKLYERGNPAKLFEILQRGLAPAGALAGKAEGEGESDG